MNRVFAPSGDDPRGGVPAAPAGPAPVRRGGRRPRLSPQLRLMGGRHDRRRDRRRPRGREPGVGVRSSSRQLAQTERDTRAVPPCSRVAASCAQNDAARPRPSQLRRRFLVWGVAGVGVWIVSGWPVAGIAVAAAGLWLPWLLGSAQVTQERLATVEALEAWCRRMADTLTGGGAIGLAQAIVTTRLGSTIRSRLRSTLSHAGCRRTGRPAPRRCESSPTPSTTGSGTPSPPRCCSRCTSRASASREVLRQLADGVARDVRARREIEARAPSRGSRSGCCW